MDRNTAMDAAAEGAKALTKFQEIILKIFGPRWTRKQADADAYADERKLKTIRDNPDMEIVYVAGQMHAREKTPEMLAQRAEQRMLTEEIRQEENIENVLEIAVQELQQDDDVSDEAVDEDWINRLFNIVKDINSKEMQYVWGKILAGEIKRPGSFSLRTLDTIRNLSQKEAKIFQKILPLVIGGGGDRFVTSNSSIHDKYGVEYEDIMILDECGLIVSNGSVTLTITISKDSIIVHNTRHALLTEELEGEKSFSFGVYSLTNAGKELLNILEYDSNDAYFNDFAEFIFEENRHSKLKIQPIESIKDNKVNITGETVREFCIS